MTWEANDLLNDTGAIKKLHCIPRLFLYAKVASILCILCITLCKFVFDLLYFTVPGIQMHWPKFLEVYA